MMCYEPKRILRRIGCTIRRSSILFLYIGLSLNTIAWGQETPTSHLVEGKRLYDNHDYDKAIIELRTAISQSHSAFLFLSSLSPDQRIEAYEYLALCYMAKNDEQTARNTFKHLLNIAPSYQPSESFAPDVRRIFQEAKDEVLVSPSPQATPPALQPTPGSPPMQPPIQLPKVESQKSPSLVLASALIPGLFSLVDGVGQWYDPEDFVIGKGILLGIHGLGQFSNGDQGKGLLFLGLGLLGAGLITYGGKVESATTTAIHGVHGGIIDSDTEKYRRSGEAAAAGAFIWGVSYIFSAIDAYNSAQRKYTHYHTGDRARYTLSGSALINFSDGQMSLAVPAVHFQRNPYVDLVRVRF